MFNYHPQILNSKNGGIWLIHFLNSGGNWLIHFLNREVYDSHFQWKKLETDF
jgi:hypothetical protein